MGESGGSIKGTGTPDRVYKPTHDNEEDDDPLHSHSFISMKFAGAVAVGLTLVHSAVAAGTLGYSLGVKNPDGSCKSQSDYANDFSVLTESSTLVRVYSASQCDTLANILPAAQSAGVQVIVGIWPDSVDGTATNEEFDALRQHLGSGDNVYAITVGSEVLYRGDYSASVLSELVTDTRNLVHNELGLSSIPIGTADSWNKFNDGTANSLIPNLDIVLVNAFSYWQGAAIEDAKSQFFDDINQAKDKIRAIDSDIHVMVGETGWPTEGDDYESAVPSVENAETFFKEGICAMLNDENTDVFVFEFSDETWKPCSVGDNGECSNVESSWGVYTDALKLKYNIDCGTSSNSSSTTTSSSAAATSSATSSAATSSAVASSATSSAASSAATGAAGAAGVSTTVSTAWSATTFATSSSTAAAAAPYAINGTNGTNATTTTGATSSTGSGSNASSTSVPPASGAASLFGQGLSALTVLVAGSLAAVFLA